MSQEIRNHAKPAFAILGRPNVGKSTLFNRITRTRNALVADVPGVTRDVQLGVGRVGRAGYLVVDTGGFEPVSEDVIRKSMAKQTLQAIDEADGVVLLVLDVEDAIEETVDEVLDLVSLLLGGGLVSVPVPVEFAADADIEAQNLGFVDLGGEAKTIAARRGFEGELSVSLSRGEYVLVVGASNSG